MGKQWGEQPEKSFVPLGVEQRTLTLGPARFAPKEPNKGSDGNANWQMIPKYGARGMILSNADGLTLRLAAGDRMTFNEVNLVGAKHREIWVSGHHTGRGVLEAFDPDTLQVKGSIELHVVKERVVRVGYFRIKDASRRSPNLVEAELPGFSDQANGILFYQGNVRIVQAFAPSTRESLADLGARVDIYNDQTRGELHNLAHDTGLDQYVFMVWALPREHTGETLGNMTVIGTLNLARKDIPKVIAHEIVHSLCPPTPDHDTDLGRDYLMYDGLPHGTKLGKRRTLQILRP